MAAESCCNPIDFAEEGLNLSDVTSVGGVEVAFQEVRTHLWVETQRQWFDMVGARTTPLMLRLSSWVTLCTGLLQHEHSILPCSWYAKYEPTFRDAIALARRHRWSAP